MTAFQVPVVKIDAVTKHPNADRLSVNRVRGFCCVSNKENGADRYKAGQLVAFVPENAIIPNSLLMKTGYWDEKNQKGFLAGPEGNIMKAINLRNVVSRGLIFPLRYDKEHNAHYAENGDGHTTLAREGDDLRFFYGIRKNIEEYFPNFPKGEKMPNIILYDVEDINMYPNMLEGHQIVITELLHGILAIVGFDRRLNEPYFVTTGVAPDNMFTIRPDDDNIYTRMARPIWDSIRRYLREMPAVERFYMFGEIIGPGIQDLTYGLETPEFRALDVQLGLMGGGVDTVPFGFIGVRKYELFKWMQIPTAPILWGGTFDAHHVTQLTNGPSALGGGLRKGVVITSEDESLTAGRRPILKSVSDKFLIRANGSNFK